MALEAKQITIISKTLENIQKDYNTANFNQMNCSLGILKDQLGKTPDGKKMKEYWQLANRTVNNQELSPTIKNEMLKQIILNANKIATKYI